ASRAMTSAILLAVPNVSEGRDAEAISTIADAFGGGEGVRLIDVHSDADHHRSVFTIAGPPPTLADAMLAGARPALPRGNVAFGPARLPPSAGATLVAARPPLVAFNLQLRAPATVADAHRIAGLVREHGVAGVPGLRAIGIELAGGVAQVSMNVERPFDVSLAE